MTIGEQQSAAAQLGAAEALALAHAAARVVVMKGKKLWEFDMQKDRPADEALLAVMLGATGNLRAPTIRRGRTLLVGFNQEIFDREFA